MARPTQVGDYLATLADWALIDDPKYGPVFDVIFNITHFYDGTDWAALAGGTQIQNRFFFLKSDGSVSRTYEQVKAALEWDGSFESLANNDWSETQVRLDIQQKGEYLNVAYMNHKDWQGRQLQHDPSAVQSVEKKYGAMFRAKFGGNATAKPAGAVKPASPTSKPTQAASALETAKRAAWTEFKTQTSAMTEDERKTAFSECLAKFGNGTPHQKFTADQWSDLANTLHEYGVALQPTLAEVPADEVSAGIAEDPDSIPF